jgi:hypothetical protein
VGRGAEGVRSSILRRRGGGEKTMRDLEEAGGGGSSSGSTSNDDDAPPLRGWRGTLDRAMMPSVVALDERDDGGGTGGDDEDARGGGARANHGAVVVFGAPPLRWCAGRNRRQPVLDGRPRHHRGVLRLLSPEARGPKESRWYNVSEGTGIMYGGSVIIWL